jgi:hypothetical protein
MPRAPRLPRDRLLSFPLKLRISFLQSRKKRRVDAIPTVVLEDLCSRDVLVSFIGSEQSAHGVKILKIKQEEGVGRGNQS